jgi:hypothetical protein
LGFWLAVISQALVDLVSDDRAHRRDRADALDWFVEPSRDFERVCTLADVEPDCVRALAKKQLAAPKPKPKPKPKERARSGSRGTSQEIRGRRR